MEKVSKAAYGGKSMTEMMAVRSEYRLQQWAQVVEQCRESRLSNREYCRQNGIAEKTYYYWLRRLRETAAQQIQNPTLVHLDAEPKAPVENSTVGTIHLRIKEAEMTIQSGVNPATIQAVIQALQCV